MVKQKIVFSDFDGMIFTFGNYNFSKVACKNFQSLLDKEPDLKIVVSSSWRHLGIEQCKNTLKANGIDPSRVIDITGDEPGDRSDRRGIQVQAWLDRNPGVTSYVILDDERDFPPNMMDRLVKTFPYVGLTEENVREAIEVLKKPYNA